MRPDTVQLWEGLIASIVAPRRRSRARSWLESPKRRGELVDELYSPAFFDPRRLHPLPNAEATPAILHDEMSRRGAKADVVELTPLGEVDGTWGTLLDALDLWVGRGGDVLLYCPSTQVAYYEWHHGVRHLLYEA